MSCEISLLKAIILVFFLFLIFFFSFPPGQKKRVLAYLGCKAMTVEHSWQLKGTEPG